MAVQIEQVDNLQELEVNVQGPGDVSRMFIIAGTAQISVVTPMSRDEQLLTEREEFWLLVGPELGQAFRHAIAVASLTGTEALLISNGDVAPTKLRWASSSVDAAYDDDAGRVRLSFSVDARAMRGNTTVTACSFQVTILASK
jgi:hypothetical protein